MKETKENSRQKNEGGLPTENTPSAENTAEQVGNQTAAKPRKLINIEKTTFFSVLILLFALVVAAVVLTYVIPKGEFGVNADGSPDYGTYKELVGATGIPIWKGLLSPILILGTSDGVALIMLCVFLLVISGAFQAMNDCGGIKVFVQRVIKRFQNKRFLLLAVITLLFMAFGSLLGLFEEMLTLLPIMVILAVSLGFDSFTGFLISIVACGFGFSSAITNPFTVIFASDIIGVNPLTNGWYRVIIFFIFYALLFGYIFLHAKRVSLHPEKSMTYEKDALLKKEMFSLEEIPNEKRIFPAYLTLFLTSLLVTVLCSVLDFLRDYTVIMLIAVFLIGGITCSLISTRGNFKKTMKSFGSGVLSALPSVAFILLASAIKYVMVEGNILPTIAHGISLYVEGQNVYLTALILFAIILVLEFFISSSTAKAIFVMSILSATTIALTKEMQVLIYTFADGYTNLLFPTSPVLLIGLSMIGVSYFKWLKKSWWLFAVTFALVLILIALGILISF